MSFQPVIPFGGYAGWSFLGRTLEMQSAAHARAPAGQRDEAHFRERIGAIGTAADLVADRRLLRLALTAFGLADDLQNRAFISRVLESDTADRRSFVNRLADKRYAEFSAAFGFGDATGPRTRDNGFADRVIGAFRDRRFEEAVGEQDESMRLALALKRDLGQLARSGQNDQAMWYRIIGTPSLREVFETAFALPKSFGSLDIDRQADILRVRTERMMGGPSVAQFSDPAQIDRLIRHFMVGEQISQVQTMGAGAVALSLLGQAQSISRSWRDRV